MVGTALTPEIRALISAKNFAALKDVFDDWRPADLADLIDELPTNEQAILFRLLPRDLATETFEYLDHAAQEQLLRSLSDEQVAAILNDMSSDDRTLLLEELPPAVVTTLLAKLSPEERKVAQALLNYPEYSIGRRMTTTFVAVRKEWTVRQVLDYVRSHGQDSETLNVIYVVSESGKLIDDVRIREFLLAPLETAVSELMDENFVTLSATDAQEEAIAVFKKYDRVALPVVDSKGSLIGIVTVDDVLDVEEAEATEDMQKMGGSEALDEPYMTISLAKMFRKRASWLVVLFIGEMLTATAMGYFEEEIAKAVVLALFVPLIISSGGNSGSQAATLMIRAMALGEVKLHDWWRVMRRELVSGFALGTLLGVIGFGRIALWSSLFPGVYGEHWVLVGLTVSFSLLGVVLWGSLSGSMLPFILKRFGADPAASSAPFVATLVDVTGLVIYFSVALLILRGTLL